MRKRTKPLDGDGQGGGNPAATLTRGLEILRAFTAADSTLGNQDLMDRTGLPKATVSRLTSTLAGLGYLHYDDRLGRYSIGPATVSLGYNALSSSPVVQIAQPLIREMTDRTGGALAIGMRDGNEMVYVANCRPQSPVSLRLNVGSRIPIWRTAMGLSYLAEVDAEQRSALLASMIRAEPEQADTIRRLVDKAIADQAEHGFVSVFGTWYSYINAVGVSFRPTDGSPLLAITCGGIVDIIPKEKCLTSIGPELVELKQRLVKRLAGHGTA